MSRKPKKKLVFIDTNIFLQCVKEELAGLNLKILVNILEKLDNDKLLLILPENIKAEIENDKGEDLDTLKKIIEDCSALQKERNKYRLLNVAWEKWKKESVKYISSRYKIAKPVLQKIFQHRNIKTIPITDQMILSGMRRAILMRRPFSSKDKAYIKHQDCIAFEALRNFLEEEKKLNNLDFIICSHDPDYFDKDKKTLHDEIIKDLNCKRVVGYSNPTEMLKKEFKIKYTEKQIKDYGSLAIITDDGATAILPGPDYNAGAIPNLWRLGLNIRFCPYCGKNISKELSEHHIGMGDFSYDYQTETMRFPLECPYCNVHLNIA